MWDFISLHAPSQWRVLDCPSSDEPLWVAWTSTLLHILQGTTRICKRGATQNLA